MQLRIVMNFNPFYRLLHAGFFQGFSQGEADP